MYVCMYVCMYVSMYVCMYVCKHACMYLCVYVCCMYVCVQGLLHLLQCCPSRETATPISILEPTTFLCDPDPSESGRFISSPFPPKMYMRKTLPWSVNFNCAWRPGWITSPSPTCSLSKKNLEEIESNRTTIE